LCSLIFTTTSPKARVPSSIDGQYSAHLFYILKKSLMIPVFHLNKLLMYILKNPQTKNVFIWNSQNIHICALSRSQYTLSCDAWNLFCFPLMWPKGPPSSYLAGGRTDQLSYILKVDMLSGQQRWWDFCGQFQAGDHRCFCTS
jgi:hypothetical protein